MISSTNSFASVHNALVTHCQALGAFDTVLKYEPKSAPGNGITACVYVGDSTGQGVTVLSGMSGLNTVAKRVVFTIRIHIPMLREPVEEIEAEILSATELVVDSLIGDLDLGTTVLDVDVFGAYGTGLVGSPGYITIDSKLYRVVVLSVPVILGSEATQG